MSAQLIAVEGIDGSGKGTQSRLLVDGLNAAGRRATLLSFPRYSDTFFGARIGDFLNGRFGSLEAVDPFLASLLFAGDRLESKPVLETALAEHDVVVLDRYVASNVAHQGAKREGAERTELKRRIEHVEFTLNALPRPDVTVWLDLPVPLATQLIAAKAKRDYTDKAADLQEADAEYLSRVAAVYEELANGDGWARVPCSADGEVRGVDAIATEVLLASGGRQPPG
ncbi:thymidylate kinase [Alienimonas chondri]|uniref:Thymidylate kinase n=1 Tax=Alienimonas chondri TaxID=2681879 RepID=A0ABX1VLU5_9PLAN|nr:thymidylate kinase [Alienimonas chondri]NNJ27541.1 Thymidylate kinase [Alienimonas chondri]